MAELECPSATRHDVVVTVQVRYVTFIKYRHYSQQQTRSLVTDSPKYSYSRLCWASIAFFIIPTAMVSIVFSGSTVASHPRTACGSDGV